MLPHFLKSPTLYPHFSLPTNYSKESDTPILLDEAEQARRLEERQKLFKEYRISRQAVLEMRDEDRQRRNEAKVKQIELAEQWQVRMKGCMVAGVIIKVKGQQGNGE